MTRIYLASSWRNDHQPRVLDLLRIAGHEVYDFRHPHLGPGARGVGFSWAHIDPDWLDWTPDQFRDALGDPLARDGFAADQEGMDWADTCVMLAPCGRSAHLEAGYMAGQGKRTIAYLYPGEEPELMYGLLDELVTTDAELLAAIEAPNDHYAPGEARVSLPELNEGGRA